MKISRSRIPIGMEVVTARVSWYAARLQPGQRNLTYSHRVQCKKGDTVSQFLEKCRQQFPELRGISADNLMYIKVLLLLSHIPSRILIVIMRQEDLIIPQVSVVVSVVTDSRADPSLVALHLLQFHRQQSAWKIGTSVQF